MTAGESQQTARTIHENNQTCFSCEQGGYYNYRCCYYRGSCVV